MRARGLWLTVYLLLGIVPNTAASELLGPQDDAGSGHDAGDSLDQALSVRLGTYQGNVTKGADQFDYYAVEFQAGWWYEVIVRSEVDLACLGIQYCVVTGDCAEMNLFAPNQTLWMPGGCWTIEPGHYYASFTQWFVAPESGTWYVGVTPGIRNVAQPYILGIRVFAPHDHVFHAQVDNLRWLALRLGNNIGTYTAVVESNSGFDGSLDTTRMGLFLPTNGGDYEGYFYRPSAFYASAANAGIQLGDMLDLRLQGNVATTGTFEPGGGVLLSWENDPAAVEGKVVAYASSAQFGARVTVGYNGTEPPVLAVGHDDGLMEERRITDFDAEVSIEGPVGGYTKNASTTVYLSDTFVGFFQLSPQLGTALPEASVGGYVDPSGRRTQIGTPEHPDKLAPLVRPSPGSWRFWFEKDYGVNGQPTVLFGLTLPAWLLK